MSGEPESKTLETRSKSGIPLTADVADGPDQETGTGAADGSLISAAPPSKFFTLV